MKKFQFAPPQAWRSSSFPEPAVLLWVLCAIALGSLGCDPIVLESDECPNEPLASFGLALGEPALAPLPEQPSLLPGIVGPTAASTDGTSFLVVWQADSSLLAVRLSGTGEVLDRPPLIVGPAEQFDWRRPAVTFDGRSYIVVWNRLKLGVWAARITPGGQLLDPGGVPLATGHEVSVLALATPWGGGNTLMAWAETVGQPRVASLYGLRSEMTLGEPIKVDFSGSSGNVSSLALASSDGSSWGLAAAFDLGSGDFHAMVRFFNWVPFFAPAPAFDLAPAGPRGQEVGLAVAGGKFLAVWGEITPAKHIEGLLMTPEGPEGIAFPITQTGMHHRAPQVSFDGAQFQVAWTGYTPNPVGHSVLATAVSTSGEVAVPNGAVLARHGIGAAELFRGLALASARGKTVVTYSTHPSTASPIDGVTGAWLTDGDGGVPIGTWLSHTRVFRGKPRVLATPSGYVALWREFGQTGVGLGGARLGPDGEVLSLVGEQAEELSTEFFDAFDAAAMGELILVTVPTRGGASLRLLGPSDTWFVPATTIPERFFFSFQVAASSEAAIVSWQSFGAMDLLVAPVSADGGMPTSAVEIVTSAGGHIRDWAIEPTDGGFGAVCLDQDQLKFLNLDLSGRVLKQSQFDESAGFVGPMHRLYLDETPTALFQVVDAGISLLGAVSEGGVPHFPLVLSEGHLTSRLARAPFGAQHLLAWVASSDGGSVPRGAWLEGSLPPVAGDPFTWPLETGVTELDVATRSPTDGLIAYAVGNAVERNIAWRRITPVDAGTTLDAGTCDAPAFLTRVIDVGPGCSQASGDMAGLLIAVAFSLRLLGPRRRRANGRHSASGRAGRP